MPKEFPLFPESASTTSGGVDAIYIFLVALTVFFSLLIFSAVFVFAVKYRRKRDDEIPAPIHGSMLLEVVWSVIPFGIVIVIFGWGTWLYFHNYNPPAGAMEIFVVGKQWMWKVQHPEGHREINEMHVPVNTPVKLTITSEDVIHSYYIPVFRLKKDAVPGMYTTAWFEATKPGTYHLFCAEYCGNQHSGMIGKVHVLEQPDYEAWLSGTPRGMTMVQAGEQLFNRLGCASCHREDNTGRGPSLLNVFGAQVRLETGQMVLADETYIRESILRPQAKIVQGYTTQMPTFQGQVSEEGLLQLIAYIRSLSKERTEAE
jgi:cytochrome c oxidase subunit II